MHPMTEKKEELKDMARKLRALKQARKPKNENYHPGINWEIYKLKRQYRHEHIAYCLVRGRTYEQIEQPKEENKIREDVWVKINNLKIALQYKVDAANAEWISNHPLFIKREVSNG